MILDDARRAHALLLNCLLSAEANDDFDDVTNVAKALDSLELVLNKH